MFAWFWIWRHSPSHLISAWNQASKSIQTLCAKSKRYHAENEHTLKVRKWKAAQNDDQNDDWRMTIFLVSESLQAHPHRASSKMTSWLVRNYSFFMAAAAFSSVAACSAASAFATASFQSLAHFMSTTPNPQERWGTHKKRWPFQPCLFADVIGLVRRSYAFLAKSWAFCLRPPSPAPNWAVQLFMWDGTVCWNLLCLFRGGGGGPSPKVRAFCNSGWPDSGEFCGSIACPYSTSLYRYSQAKAEQW